MAGAAADGSYRFGGGAQAVDQDDGCDNDKGDGHCGEYQPAKVSEPGDSSDQDDEPKCDQQPPGRQRGEVGDGRRSSGGHADRDGEDEIDHESADGDEGPAVSEGFAGRCRCASSLGITDDELPVIEDDKGNDHHHQGHGGYQQCQIPVQGAQGRFDGVGDRRNRIGHHCESEREQERGAGAQETVKPAARGGAVSCRHEMPLCAWS